MTTRRNFILNSFILSTISTSAFTNSISNNTEDVLNNVKLYIPIYGINRLPIKEGFFSSLAKINPYTDEVLFEPSKVYNLHSVIESSYNNPDEIKIGIGQASKEFLQLYDKNFNNLNLVSFKDLMFRGHGINYKEGLLICAEDIDPNNIENGILLYVDSYGNELGRFKTGGSRPHEIVDCGDYFAIAHYGDARERLTPPTSALIDNCNFLNANNIISPGVSFVDKKDLNKHIFYSLPKISRITHLAVTNKNTILAMGINEYLSFGLEGLKKCSIENNITLLNVELESNIYESYIPIYHLSHNKGLIEEINYPIKQMRRGQSFSFDKSINAIVGTFSASQTLFIQINDKRKIINTLKFGVPDPRGCTFIPGTGLVAVSGNSDNIAIIDIFNEKLIKIIGTPLGHHSHLYAF